MNKDKKSNGVSWGALSLVTALTAAKLGWILYSKRYIDHNAKLNIILDAEQHTFDSHTAGKINFFVNPDGNRTPVLLVHGLHLYAGLHDMLPIFDSFRTVCPIYAIDLPGFGRSQKSDRPYRPSMYAAAISDFIKGQIGKPCHVVCLGNASEYVSMAAVNQPELFKSIIMINPSGLQMPSPTSLKGASRMEKLQDIFLSWLKVPLWSLPLYDIIASRPRIASYYHERFCYQTSGELIDLAYTSTHQAGAHFAPMVLLSGKLKVPGVRERFYEKLTVPTLAVYDNEPGRSFDMLPQMVRENENWQAFRSRNTKGMPHFEKPGELFRQFDLFWEKHA
jgi:pimeloyl-ACP methyl ester carboxylesterase